MSIRKAALHRMGMHFFAVEVEHVVRNPFKNGFHAQIIEGVRIINVAVRDAENI